MGLELEVVPNFNSEDVLLSYPRGGPIFIAGFVGPLTSVPVFELSVTEDFDALQAELCSDISQSYDDELLIDELKVFTDEELAERALKEAFKDHVQSQNTSELSEGKAHDMLENGHRNSNNESTCAESSGQENIDREASESSNDGASALVVYQAPKKKKRGRRFDRYARDALLSSDVIAKVEELAKIKQKQEEDKAAVKLHALKTQAKEGAMPPSDNVERMRSLRFITSGKKVKALSSLAFVPVRHPEVVLCVEIYHCIRKKLKTHEYLVLGRQRVTELRDKIHCFMDELMCKEELHDPSGYFLIEDVFCKDMRDPSAIDYSEPIFDWMRNNKDDALQKWSSILSKGLKKFKAFLPDSTLATSLPSFKAVDMHNTLFCDLKFRLGAGYLYCHQGDCKHTMVIRDMRLFHPEDVQNKAAYPLLVFEHQTFDHKCSICGIFRAVKVTYDDKWAPTNPSYFCENCYYLLHYSKDGSLLYNDFTVYDCSYC
ncbi:hypothetical protein AMTRI_Chr10g8170 [Amborella trichopoda]|uniref:snRNA-activating protein complex subunit isoform X2 n=1 Tax=Amborella trichopoda TaxID=13333 RepID=UPI0005D2DD25|nr:snRNA-activating protein complex subunit isoform X2 [Amborella trichopoda]|eukprot:XP_011628222.1 snRNA-activating protein complex subunit isoform X2 [Amborella trichopoda]